MNSRKWLGMGIGFIGFIPVLAMQKGSTELLTTLSFISWPDTAFEDGGAGGKRRAAQRES